MADFLKTSYDSYNYEIQSILHPNINFGIRTEVNKTFTKNIQLTGIINNSSKQYFATLFGERNLSHKSNCQNIFQFGFEPTGSFQIKSSLIIRNGNNKSCDKGRNKPHEHNGTISSYITKYQSIVSKNREIFSQLEYIYNSNLYNIAIKLVKPAFEASSLIYIGNCWKPFGILNCGFEIVSLNSHLTIGLCGRVEHNNFVSCISLQKFNLLTMSFYKKFMNICGLELGVELKKSKENKGIQIGSRIKNNRSEIKCSIDNFATVGFSWEEKLCENLTVGFCGEYDFEDFNYGVSMVYDD